MTTFKTLRAKKENQKHFIQCEVKKWGKTQKSNNIFLYKSLRNSISEVDNKNSNASKQYQLQLATASLRYFFFSWLLNVIDYMLKKIMFPDPLRKCRQSTAVCFLIFIFFNWYKSYIITFGKKGFLNQRNFHKLPGDFIGYSTQVFKQQLLFATLLFCIWVLAKNVFSATPKTQCNKTSNHIMLK